MEHTYLWLLNYSYGGTMVIRLTREEIEESKKYGDFENFIREELEDKYMFNLSDCCWMTSNQYEYERINF